MEMEWSGVVGGDELAHPWTKMVTGCSTNGPTNRCIQKPTHRCRPNSLFITLQLRKLAEPHETVRGTRVVYYENRELGDL